MSKHYGKRTPEEIAAIVQRVANGEHIADVEKELDIPTTQLNHWCRKAGVTGPPARKRGYKLNGSILDFDKVKSLVINDRGQYYLLKVVKIEYKQP